MRPYPLQFRPLLKQIIWGGRRLGSQLGKPIGQEANYAESWEIVDHGADQSVVENGPLAGQTLAWVIANHRNWLLGSADSADTFPLLLKYLDCNRVLSVQVHPSDAYAQRMEKPDLGKTEAWYIVAAEPASLVYAGLKPNVDCDALAAAIDDGQAESVLHSFHPSPGDVVFIPAGTVHALGAGLLVCEIQQSSDTTFRLFDWNRVDADGHPRQLHLQQGLEVSDYQSGPVQPRRGDDTTDGWQPIVQCDKFVLRVMKVGADHVGGDGKFHIVTVPQGTATLQFDGETKPLSVGATVLLPAAMDRATVTPGPNSAVLTMQLP